VDVIDLRESQFESLPLAGFMKRVGRKIPNMNRIFSIYRDSQILPMVGVMAQLDPRELVVTFDGLLRSAFPRDLKTMLDLLEEGLGEPVDIEFAHDGESLYMLQCRALSRGAMAQQVEVPVDVPESKRVFSANRHVQMGQVRNLEYVVMIDPRDYESLETRDEMLRVARTVGAVNKVMPQKRFLLMGPGRWGSRGDIRLGVPVTYADICRTALLVEIARKKGSYVPDVSFGTHFFNDLVESGIHYLPVYPDDSNVIWNEDFFNRSSNCLAEVVPEYADMEGVVRVIRVPEVANGDYLQVIMDAEADKALGFLAKPT
jgi:pyruvate, water dikinase